MAETVSKGVRHEAEGDLFSMHSEVPASWDWKLHLRESPRYSPITSATAQDARLSFGELRVWVVCNADSDPAAYNVPMAWRLSGPLAAGGLSWSLKQVEARREAW